MKRGRLRLGTVVLASTLMFGGLSSLSAYASENQTQPYLWDEETKEIKDYSAIVPNTIVDETIANQHLDKVIEAPRKNGVAPLAIFRTLERYDQSSAYTNYTYKFVDRVIGDNRLNLYTPLEIWFETEKSGTTTVEGNISVQASAEKQLVVAKVNASVTVGGSLSRSWTSGTKYGAKTVVPAKIRGALTGYIPYSSTNGQMVYKLTTDSTGEVRYEYVPMGGWVPAKTSWNIVPQIPFND